MLQWLAHHCKVDVTRYLGTSWYASPSIEAFINGKIEALKVLFELGAEPIDLLDETVNEHLQRATPFSKDYFTVVALNRKWAAAKDTPGSFQGLLSASDGARSVPVAR